MSVKMADNSNRGRVVVRGFIAGLAVAVVMLSGMVMVTVGGQSVTLAQEATPPSDEGMMSPEGVTFEPLTVVPGVSAADPMDLVLVRIGIDPGAALPSGEEDPDGGLILVESGTLTIRMETPLTISRAGSFLGAIATAEATGTFTPAGEELASGEEATLEAGDAVYVPAHVAGELRNDGPERAVVLGILFTGASEAEGTPTS